MEIYSFFKKQISVHSDNEYFQIYSMQNISKEILLHNEISNA